jgi:hypothetical protein
MMHYALANAGKQSIRTACLRIVRKQRDVWTTAAKPVTCEACKQTPYYRERRAAKGLDVIPGKEPPLPVFHTPIALGARSKQPELRSPEFIEYLGPLPPDDERY